ncbi:MAG: cytidylate kinase-like family protein [Propionicimonas sp.]|uniref:cytidylate kinase-like family protein n=1 Tax=Propionicimonas sp. TaxID=1955623 RepID=UPI003D0DCF5E
MTASIVINREFGSGGREIGRRLCERDGLEFYDSRILQLAASRRGLPSDALEALDERLGAGQFLDLTAIGGSTQGSISVPAVLFSAIAGEVVGAARSGPAVFIGRCADRILRDAGLPFLSVFVFSTNNAQKAARAIRVDGIEPRDAARYIAKMDRTRARYQQFFTGTRFGDYHEYDLCLNSARLGYAGCVDVIRAAVAAAGRA